MKQIQEQNNMDISNTLSKKGLGAYMMIGESHNADMYYTTGFFASDKFTYLQTNSGDEILLVSEMERERAENESRITNIRTTQDYDYRSKIKSRSDPSIAFSDTLGELLGKEGIRKIGVPHNFPFFIAQTLKEQGFWFMPIKSPFKDMRTKKSESEIANIETVQNACEEAMDTAVNLISNSSESDGVLYNEGVELTSEYVRNAIEHRLLDFGCEAETTIVACGKQSSTPHWMGEGTLKVNEPIIIDIFPRSKTNRYFSDMSRTVVKGTPPRQLKDMYDAVIEAQNKALELVKPGVLCNEIHNAVCDVFEEKGYDTVRNNPKLKSGFLHSTGHGVGLEVHELPSLGDNENQLESGNVITVEPGLYYPDIGGVRIEDIVVVTEKGCRNLTEFEKKFVV